MRFKSGMLGCCIVVLALFGTILSGFFLGVEPSQRETVTYDYVTDVTGLFNITQAPEYVSYNPSTNYVGYTPNGVIDYTQSSTVNSYRYVLAPGLEDSSTYTINYNSSYTSDTGRFTPSEIGTSALINWTGSINFGSTTTWQGVTYNCSTASENVQVGDMTGAMPMITSMARVLDDVNLGTYNVLDITVSYGSMPILFYYGSWNFTDVERGDGYTQYIYDATMNESNSMPDRFQVNLATYSVKAYKNDNLLYNVNAGQIDVIYRYSTRAGGSFSPATDSSATFSITATTYPTYGYMDPTKGVSMSNVTTETQAITSNDSYTNDDNFFNRPNIWIPPQATTETQNVTESGGYVPDTVNFSIGEGIYINWTGSINFGSTITIPGAGVVWNGALNFATTDGPAPHPRAVTTVGGLMDSWGWNYSFSADISYASTYPILFYGGAWTDTVYNGHHYYSATMDESNSMPDHLEYDINTDLVTASLNNVTIWTADKDNVSVIYSYETNVNGYPYEDAHPTATMSVSYTASGYYLSLYKVYGLIDYDGDYNGQWIYDMTIDGGTYNTALYGQYDSDPNAQPTIAYLSTILSYWGYDNPSYTYTLDLTHGDFPVFIWPVVNAYDWDMIGLGDYTDTYAHYGFSAGTTSPPYAVPDRIVYDGATGTATAYRLVSDNYTALWTADPSDVWVAYKYSLLATADGLDGSIEDNQATVNTQVNVTVNRGITATWQNGYQNDTITMTIKPYTGVANNLTITAGASYFTINVTASGGISGTDGLAVLDIGKWKYIQVRMDATNGTLSVTPFSNLSFTSPSPENNTTQVITDWYSGGTIETLTFTTTGQSPKWQITATSVFLDTFNSVMYNPSINIQDYFPGMDQWRLNFYSFATYGDSFTINNVPFTVDRSRGTCTWLMDYNGTIREYTQPLNNMYITNEYVGEQEHIFLTFLNNKTVYDLGPTVTNVVTFSGLWFFTTGLYDVINTFEDYYDWALDSAFHIDGTQAILIFLGLLIVGSLLAKGLFKISFKSLDGVVIVGAGLILVLLIGGI